MLDAQNHPSVDSYIPQRVSSSISLRSRSDRPPWCEYPSVSMFHPRLDIFRLASRGSLSFRRVRVIYRTQIVHCSLHLLSLLPSVISGLFLQMTYYLFHFFALLRPQGWCSSKMNHVVLFPLTLGLHSAPTDSSGPSSTVSSAGPSSPTTADTSPRFSFSDKISLTPQSSEETHSSQSVQPAPAFGSQGNDPTTTLAEVPLTPNNSSEEDEELGPATDRQPNDPEHTQEVAPPAREASDPCPIPPCSSLVELTLSRMEGYCLPGSLPVLLELRESSSEAGSSSQTPQSPEGLDEFFDTQESMELWMDSPEDVPQPETPQDGGATQSAEP